MRLSRYRTYHEHKKKKAKHKFPVKQQKKENGMGEGETIVIHNTKYNIGYF